MRRWTVTTAVLISIGSTQLGHARAREPVCREPSVVDEMKREIRSQNYYSNVEAILVTEQPGRDPSVVNCQVCVEVTPYDTIRFGSKPVGQCLAHDFEVRILPTGFVVRNLP
jgi:NAD-dependent dihydropyrimidine dehydrogenase PreA subunit